MFSGERRSGVGGGGLFGGGGRLFGGAAGEVSRGGGVGSGGLSRESEGSEIISQDENSNDQLDVLITDKHKSDTLSKINPESELAGLAYKI